tara:strand:+ start:2873 stop:3622 length:750 start_codon:yes stop_codon:yes gene_type:complete
MRIIARLDIKSENLIKGIQFEGLRVIGNPNEYALKYYKNNADEILLIDTVASLYNRNNLVEIINKASENIFVPITAGGGIREIKDVEKLLKNGADKVFVNTGAVNNPQLINDLVKEFGSQSIVCSIEAKKISENKWEVYTENGREKTNLDLLEWLTEAVDRGAGEVILTSIDNDGTKKGFDLQLFEKINKSCDVPLIFSGGMSCPQDILGLENLTQSDGIALASILHYENYSIRDIKNFAKLNNFHIKE